MSRIAEKFEELRRRGEGALIAFITAGDPAPEITPSIVQVLAKHADVVELGLPFSDPIADGPTIQEATDRALRAGTDTDTVLEIVKEIREGSDVPLVILTYFNPVLQFGIREFLSRLAHMGGDGIIVPDLPIDESGEFRKIAREVGIDTIQLVAPTTPPSRVKTICERSSGFVYVVSLLGVTGPRERLSELVRPTIKKVKRLSKIPIAVGFGISKPEHVRAVLDAGADGAIVGSAFVKLIKENLSDVGKMLEELETFSADLKRATKKLAKFK